MLVFFVFIYSFLTIFIQKCISESNLQLFVSPAGHMYGQGPPILIRETHDSLNLTCKLVDPGKENLSDHFNISWNWQYSSTGNNANRVMVVSLAHNEANLVFESLKETDSGEYTCKCIDLDLEKHVRLKVRPFKKYCNSKMFPCSTGHCIPRRYVCDGKPDCKHGDDEAEKYCGSDPCKDKIPCEEDGRCIPISWCCDEYHDPNCTTKEKPKCCQFNKQDLATVPSLNVRQQLSDMGFLQTTIYTVIGCAMAFMFIVTILVIAICRVHLKRTVISRCPLNHQHHRPGSPLRPTLPLYDIDMFLDRQDTGGLLVTYNINNGVQFVGRPIDPPPYCEIMDMPPREGPPPPYISRENLTVHPEPPETVLSEVDVEPEFKSESVDTISVVSTEIHVPEAVVNNLKGCTNNNNNNKPPIHHLLRNLDHLTEDLKNQGTSSLGDVSKLPKQTTSYDICSSVPSVSGLSKLNPKSIKRTIISDFSDSESDSSCLENDALLQQEHHHHHRKPSENTALEELKARSLSAENNNHNSSSFINNIAAVSKSLIGSFNKKPPLDAGADHQQKPRNDRIARISPKPFRALLTQKSFDSTEEKCKQKSSASSNARHAKRFDKIVTNNNVTHSMGDLSPVNTDSNYNDYERRDFLTLPLRESFIGVRNEEA